MSGRRAAIVFSVLALLLPAAGAAQGLGDTAAREKEKRAKQEKAAKKAESRVFTNEDLNEGRPPDSKPGPAASAGSGSAPAPEPSAESPEAAPQVDPQEAVRPQIDALQQAQAHAAAVEARVNDLAAKLNPMSGSFIYGSQGSNDANDEAETRQQLQAAEAELREARAAVSQANQALDDARRGRFPSSPSSPSVPH